jgi:AraC-like DNA-binding protein
MKTCAIKSLLWWCICLLVVGSRHTVDGRNSEPRLKFWADVHQITTRLEQTPSDKNYRLPTTDYRLPCQDSSPACLRTLSDIAVRNNLEIRTLDQAVQWAQKKRWTTWLNADGLNPLAIGLRIARNIAGGGDRAALQLDIANLARRRAEVETNLRQAITQAVSDYEAAERRVRLAQAKLAAHEAKLKFLEVAYRLGEGETETMLTRWQQREELQAQIITAETETITQQRKLEALVNPASSPQAE